LPRYSTKIDIGLSSDALAKDYWESEITTDIRVKSKVDAYQGQSMVVRQASTGVAQDLQLYRNVSGRQNGRQFDFGNIPPPDPYCSQDSRIGTMGDNQTVKEIYNKPGNSSVEKHYQAAKLRQSHKVTLEPPGRLNSNKNSLIIDPKDPYKTFDVQFPGP